jgi:hypothetical protein
MRRCCCDCNTIDPVFAGAVMGALNEALVTYYLIFRKKAYINLVFFKIPYTQKRTVEYPKRRYSAGYHERLISFCKECISLIDNGWENSDAFDHYERMKTLVERG